MPPRFWKFDLMQRYGLPMALLVAIGGLIVVAASAAAATTADSEGGVQVITLAPSGADRGYALAFSGDGRRLAVGSTLGVYLYDGATLAQTGFIPTDAWVDSVAFSPDGQTLATGAYDDSVRLWRAADGTLLRVLQGHTGWVRSVAFSPDGQTLASASDDNTVRLWRVSDGAEVRRLTEGTEGVRAVALSPDGATLATGGFDNRVRLWRVADGTLLRTLAGHTNWVRCLAFSPDGQTLASGGFDVTVRLWRVADGALLQTLAGHTASVLGVAFAPDGATLATASEDKTVRLWRAADGAALHVLSGHTDFVYAVAFRPDGQTLASAAADNTARVWEVGPAAAWPPAGEAEPAAETSSCVACHHPRGDFLQPGGLTLPPRVAEVTCATCHTGSTLVLNWCPAFPRSPGQNTPASVISGVASPFGLSRGTPDFGLEISSPVNGEHFYAPPLSTAMPISGRVFSAGAATADVELRLEIWSGSQRTAVVTERPQADGSFYFNTNLRPDGPKLEVPIEQRSCVQCHSETLERVPALPAGDVRLVVTAVRPDGQEASDGRWIVVDRGQSATATVTVIDEATGQPVAGLPIEASARLYDWLGRTFSGATGADGVAELQVEALGGASTEYTFEVKPIVIDGRLYEGAAPVQIVLPAGATGSRPVTLTARSRAGHLAGRLDGAGAGVAIHAIHLPEGERYEAATASDGRFAFADLPIGQYLVLADTRALAAKGLAGTSETIDLAASPEVEITLRANPEVGGSLAGQVRDQEGSPLPFAWVSAEPDRPGATTSPDTGGWLLTGLAPDAKTLVFSAPGYYSQAYMLPPAGQPASVLTSLTPRPDTRRITWGSGEIVVPAESQVTLDERLIEVDAGWLWGAGIAPEPVVIRTAGAVITLHGGRFALEALPGQTAWLYLFEGEAEAYRTGAPDKTTHVTGPAMLALPGIGKLAAVAWDAVAAQALRPAATPWQPVWEPSAIARLRNSLALVGVTTAQVVTFVTYSSVVLALFALPIASCLRWAGRRRPRS